MANPLIPSVGNTIQQLENQENWKKLYEILAEAHPGRDDIQAELGKLSNNKNSYVKQIQAQWEAKPTPLYTEADIKRINSAWYSNRTVNGVVGSLLDRVSTEVHPRDWIIKSEQKWIAWDSENSEYMSLPIRFDGEIKFEKFYEQLIISDRKSSSCNLIWSIRKLIDAGGAACLSDTNWISLWLTFAKKYMSSAYPTLSRYSDNLEVLFRTMISNINADEEVSKLRSTMSKLNRSPGTPLQVPLYELKSYYELLVGINFPLMEPETVTTRSDSYASNCTKFFITKNTRVALDSFVQMKMQKGEKTNLMSICQVVGHHEASNPADQLQTVMFLPEHATRLDIQMSSATNVEELFINSTIIDRGRPRQDSKSPAGSSRNGKYYSNNRGSNARHNDSRRNTNNTSSTGSDYYRKKSQSPYTRPQGGGNGTNGSRSGTPRTGSGRRRSLSFFQSPNGRKYTRSPGKTTFRRFSKSPNSGQKQNTQDTRGRQSDRSSNQTVQCIRCGGAHNASFCQKYDWWEGPPCDQCGRMHDTRLHRGRSITPGPRNTHPGQRRIKNYQSEIIPGQAVTNEDQINYFEKN